MSDQLSMLLAAHEYISREMGHAKANMDENKFTDGHLSGLKEARNRVERAIAEMAVDDDRLAALEAGLLASSASTTADFHSDEDEEDVRSDWTGYVECGRGWRAFLSARYDRTRVR